MMAAANGDPPSSGGQFAVEHEDDEEQRDPTQARPPQIAWPPAGYRTSGDSLLDAPVQATHLDAAGAKAVCATLGYFEDPWIGQIVPAFVAGRKSPIMHRGYYLRYTAMRRAAERFIKAADPNLPIQIVDLGAGLNTLYWYVAANIEKWGRKLEDLVFFEADFPVIVSKKTKTLLSKLNTLPRGRELLRLDVGSGPPGSSSGDVTMHEDHRGPVPAGAGPGLPPPLPNANGARQVVVGGRVLSGPGAPTTSSNGTSGVTSSPTTTSSENLTTMSATHRVQQFHTAHYRLVACDMRQPREFQDSLFHAGWNGMANTLFVSECVLVYMQGQFGDEVIKSCLQLCQEPSGRALKEFVVYEQCNPDTAFGKMMVRNLHQRGCPLMSITDYKTPADQEARYKALGFAEAKAWTMNEHERRVMTDEELKRIGRLEFLDEVEELRLFQDHYFLLVACNQGYKPEEIY
ncbi:unnamed protein product [Amoebophrya sp. A25]|nr:unnamed protein product [Amoebophrya sp. A25]|eukprot:GSA25T00018084001.1